MRKVGFVMHGGAAGRKTHQDSLRHEAHLRRRCSIDGALKCRLECCLEHWVRRELQIKARNDRRDRTGAVWLQQEHRERKAICLAQRTRPLLPASAQRCGDSTPDEPDS